MVKNFEEQEFDTSFAEEFLNNRDYYGISDKDYNDIAKAINVIKAKDTDDLTKFTMQSGIELRMMPYIMAKNPKRPEFEDVVVESVRHR